MTGDRPAAARSVAKKVHVQQVEAELTPAGKAEWIQRRQQEGRIVAMVGDGINDAPALAIADVGLALGGVGTDIAAEAGSIVLMGDPLEPLPGAIRLARQTVRIIRQNILLFAFGVNTVAVILAGLRILGPVAAAIFHQIGSLLVLLNAMRLLGFERWNEFSLVRWLNRFVFVCRACRPSNLWRLASHHGRALTVGSLTLAGLVYLGSGITCIGPDEMGVVRRWGRYQAPLLGPGLHFRWPVPLETVTKVEPGRVRSVRIGLSGQAPATERSIAWNVSHGSRRNDGALYFTGDESLVELAGVVEYHDTKSGAIDRIFNTIDVDFLVEASSEASFREVVARTPLEDILVARRGEVEERIEQAVEARLRDSGQHLEIDRVRIVDAHPPREVVPAYRDVSAAVSDVERYRNDAEAYAAERSLSAKADSQTLLDRAETRAHQLRTRTKGESQAFFARQRAFASQPELTEFRLLWNTLSNVLPGRPKLILDPKASGRRHIWLANPDRFGVRPMNVAPAPPPGSEIDD